MRLAAGALLAALIAAPAAADEPAQRRPRTSTEQANAARRTLRVFGGCVAHVGRTGRPHARLISFLSNPPSSEAGAAAAQDLAMPQCLDGAARLPGTYVEQLRMKPELLRGQVFRTMYFDQLRGRSGAQIARAVIEPGFALPSTEGFSSLQQFGDCVVAGDPATAAAAIGEEPGSAAETEAYRALGPALSRCVQGGSSVRFSRSVIEGLLAEALYKRLNSVAAPVDGRGGQQK